MLAARLVRARNSAIASIEVKFVGFDVVCQDGATLGDGKDS